MAISKSLLKPLLALLCTAILSVAASPKNVIYWGQASSDDEGSLRSYCTDSTYDILVIGFVYNWPSSPGDSAMPGMNLAGHCGNEFSSHQNLLNCPEIGADITYCQGRGKKVMISLGGADGTYGFSSDNKATAFAQVMWDLFLGGSSATRPFGTAVLDGIDLDVESGSATGYVAFINALRAKFANANKQYYISAAPQCPYPDDWLGPGPSTAFSGAWFDWVWVQFYNNYCGLGSYGTKNWNFATWANWATTQSLNPNVKVFIGAPASPSSAGDGYVSLSKLQTIAAATNAQYPNVFGGIMMWDAGSAQENNNIGASIAVFLKTLSGSSEGGAGGATPSTTGRPASNPPPSNPPPSNPPPTSVSTSCNAVGKMQCATSRTYQTCVPNGNSGFSWSGSQNCPSGLYCNPSGSVIYCTTEKPATSSTSTSSSGSSSPNTPCTDGNMKCMTQNGPTYQVCDRGTWTATRTCQSGLKCSPSGNYIYCV